MAYQLPIDCRVHEIIRAGRLSEEGLNDDVVVAAVPSVVEIINKSTEHGSGFPPVVWWVGQ